MKLLDYSAAKYFWASNLQGLQGGTLGSGKSFFASRTAGETFREGTSNIELAKGYLLGEAERGYFLSISLFRRSIDLMIDSASPWAYVTLYYSSFYAARSVACLLGGWLDAPNWVLEPKSGTPGKILLVLHGENTVKKLTSAKGSHRMFWNLYYDGVGDLKNWVDKKFEPGIVAPSTVSSWQIQKRNELNYDSWSAFQMIDEFRRIQKPKGFPKWLPLDLEKQFRASEATIAVLSLLRKDFGMAKSPVLNYGGKLVPQIGKEIVSKAHPKFATSFSYKHLVNT